MRLGPGLESDITSAGNDFGVGLLIIGRKRVHADVFMQQRRAADLTA